MNNKRSIFSGILVLGLLQSMTSHALPLLAQNAGQRISDAVTLYPDHADPKLFYFMPNSSTFAKAKSSGLPEFGLTYWGLNGGGSLADAGAFMAFSMRLHSDASQKKALDAFVRAGNSIAVLPVQASTIGISSSNGSTAPLGRLFEEFNFSKKAGRAEDEVGVNALLTGLGAKVFRAAVEGTILVKFDYCYQVQGLGPDFDASIDVDWTRVYDHYQAHASGGWWFFRWQVDKEVATLRQNNAIRIQVNGGNAADEEYVKAVADQIVQRLFVPDLKAQPVVGQNEGGWSFSRLNLKSTHHEEIKSEHWSLKRRDLVEREFCVPMALGDLGPYQNQLIHDADAHRGGK